MFIRLSFLFLTGTLIGCDFADKEEEEEEEEEKEGDSQGDCTDGEDNDDDGFTDCDDLGCSDKSACISIDDDIDTGEDTTLIPIEVGVSWGVDSVDLEIGYGDDSASYYWGIAENTGDCLSSEWGCWTGEDCYMGYYPPNGGLFTYCHPVSTSGGSLSYGASPDAVAEGSTTVFTSDTFIVVTTHILDNTASLEEDTCWTWGADTSYYNGYDKTCIEM